MKKPQNIICLLFGHKDTDLNDSGYAVCERCSNHAYYHGWEFGFFKSIWTKVLSKIKTWSNIFNSNEKSQLPF